MKFLENPDSITVAKGIPANQTLGKHVASSVQSAQSGPKTIEIAGKTILAMPLESMGMTDEQKKKFENEGGLINPPSEISMDPENEEKMMYWIENFEEYSEEIDGQTYAGFPLFQKVYEGFPDISSLSESEATAQGLYPYFYGYSYTGRVWMAQNLGGRLVELDENYKGEFRDIYDATTGDNNIQRCAQMGQALFVGRIARDDRVDKLDYTVYLSSGSLYGGGPVLSFTARRNESDVFNSSYPQTAGVSCLIVMNPIASV